MIDTIINMDEKNQIKQLKKALSDNTKLSTIFKKLLQFKEDLKPQQVQWIQKELWGYKFKGSKSLGGIVKELPSYRVRRGILYHAPNALTSVATGTINVTQAIGQIDEVPVRESIEDLEMRNNGIIITYSDPSFSDKAIIVLQTEVDDLLRIVRHRTEDILEYLERLINGKHARISKAKSKSPRTGNHKQHNLEWVKIITSVAIIAGIIGSIIAILGFLGYGTITDFIDKSDNGEFNPKMGISFPDIIFSCGDGYSSDYNTDLLLEIEVWTPHLSQIRVNLVDYNFSAEMNRYLNYKALLDLPESSGMCSITMENYSYSIDEGHNAKHIKIPISIHNLWVDVFYTVYDTNFKLGTVRLQVELVDIEDEKNTIKEDYIIPMYWKNKE